jgi:hypothetical protein
MLIDAGLFKNLHAEAAQSHLFWYLVHTREKLVAMLGEVRVPAQVTQQAFLQTLAIRMLKKVDFNELSDTQLEHYFALGIMSSIKANRQAKHPQCC